MDTLKPLLCELAVLEISTEVSLNSKRISDAWLRGVTPEQVQKVYRILEDEEFPANFVKRLYTNQPSQLTKIYEEMMGVLRSLTTSHSSMLGTPSDALQGFRTSGLDRYLLQLEHLGDITEDLAGQKLLLEDGSSEAGPEEVLPEAPETSIPQSLTDWHQTLALKRDSAKSGGQVGEQPCKPTSVGNRQQEPLFSRLQIMLQAPGAVASDSGSLSSSRSRDSSSRSDSSSESSRSRSRDPKSRKHPRFQSSGSRSVGSHDSSNSSQNPSKTPRSVIPEDQTKAQ